jgi:hypothetical protein
MRERAINVRQKLIIRATPDLGWDEDDDDTVRFLCFCVSCLSCVPSMPSSIQFPEFSHTPECMQDEQGLHNGKGKGKGGKAKAKGKGGSRFDCYHHSCVHFRCISLLIVLLSCCKRCFHYSMREIKKRTRTSPNGHTHRAKANHHDEEAKEPAHKKAKGGKDTKDSKEQSETALIPVPPLFVDEKYYDQPYIPWKVRHTPQMTC